MVSRDTPDERRQMLLQELIVSGQRLSDFT
jgi:hypothetical protein